MSRFVLGGVAWGVGLLAWAGTAVGANLGPEIEEALARAGRNRGALEAVLDHYAEAGDPERRAAAEFLIANMPGHGYAVNALLDEHGNDLRFEALSYGSLAEAQAAMDAIEAEAGPAEFGRARFDADLETITAPYLIEQVDLAVAAWREKPWAAGVTFEAFCEYILPYRGSNEPLGRWRGPCLARFADLPAQMDDPTDPAEAGRRIRDEVRKWVRFRDIFYLHPTDQSFEEMTQRGSGRCEDISNMLSYALRANAVLSATDYTPWWATRDNNHAWEVLLDGEGHGRAPLSHRPAKVYRKMFSIQRDSLGFVRTDDEPVPRWLSGTNYRDVTSEYVETSNVDVLLTEPVPDGHRFAYACVFNGGEWRAIHWGAIDDGRVEFTRLGREIVYLPAYYVDGALVPAAPPFLLAADGSARPQVARAEHRTFTLGVATDPEAEFGAEGVVRALVSAAGLERTFELFAWKGEWRSLGRRVIDTGPVTFADVPEGVLLWLVDLDGRRLERPFTIEQGRPVYR